MLFLDQPSLSCEHRYEVAENDPVQTVCKPGGLPGPVVSWIKDGKELSSSRQWQKEDSGDYLVRATNKHGTAEHQLYLDVLCMFQTLAISQIFLSRSAAVPLIPFLALVRRRSALQQRQFHLGGDPRWKRHFGMLG